MGLNDLVDEENRQSKEEKGDQIELDEAVESDTDDEPEKGPHRKPCHRCGYLGARHVIEHSGDEPDGRHWICSNPDCGVETYQLGWNEWRNESDFLAGYDYVGWRYQQGSDGLEGVRGER